MTNNALICFEPPRKRFRLIAEEKGGKSQDLVQILPREVINKIFLLLDNFDIFGAVTLVCKRWNEYVNSEVFWRSFLAFEFGEEVERRLLLRCQGDSTLMVNRMREILSFDREITLRTNGATREKKTGFLYGSLEDVQEELENKREKVESKEVYYKGGFRILNLAKMVPHAKIAFNNLKLQFAIRGTSSSKSSPFNLLDSDFKLLETFQRPSNDNLLWLVASPEFWSSSCYLVTEDIDFRIRLLLPSGGTRLKTLKECDSCKLIDAAGTGDVPKIVEILSKEHPEIEGVGKKRPLVEAAKKGHIQAIQVLLKAGAKLERADINGFTPLGAAVANGRIECCRFLLDCGAKIDNSDGEPAFLVAVRLARPEIVQLLIDRGANVNIRDSKGMNALHYMGLEFRTSYFDNVKIDKLKSFNKKQDMIATFEDDFVSLLDCLIQAGCDVNAISEDKKMETPLMTACRGSELKLAKWLIDRGADVRIKDKERGNAFHHLAEHVDEKHFESTYQRSVNTKEAFTAAYDRDLLTLLDLLVQGGCDINAICEREEEYTETMQKMTPLIVTCDYHDYKLAEWLIDRGADVNLQMEDALEPTALIQAIDSTCYIEKRGILVKLLLEKGANATLEVRSSRHKTALEALFPDDLCYEGRELDIDLLKLLIKYGADVNVKPYPVLGDEKPAEPSLFHQCLSFGLYEAAKLLICSGINVNLADDENGMTPLMYVVKNGDVELIEKLIEHGADVNARDKKGQTALMYAAMASHLDKKALKRIKKSKQTKSLEPNAPIVEALLRHGADVTLKDNKGRIAEDFIERKLVNACRVFAFLDNPH